MQTQSDLLKTYQAKDDEELVRLAAAPEQLTSEARLALESELSRRQIKVEDDFESPQSSGRWNQVGNIALGGRPQEGRQAVGEFVAEVLRTYHSHFWLYFKITAPAVIISTIAIITGRNEGREIARHLPRGFELLAHRTEVLEIWLADLSAYLVSWLAFSFSFGAICIAVEETRAGYSPSAWHSLVNVRERMAAFLRLCFLLFALMLVAEAASMLLETGVFWALHQWQVHSSQFLIMVVSYGTVGIALLVLSRFALAVPAVILDDCRVVQAMFRSDELTQGKWLILAALLAKSLIGSYIAAMFPFWLASLIRVRAPMPSWFPWILTVASRIGVTAIEPTMFVGFALLYLKASAQGSAPSKVLTTQLQER